MAGIKPMKIFIQYLFSPNSSIVCQSRSFTNLFILNWMAARFHTLVFAVVGSFFCVVWFWIHSSSARIYWVATFEFVAMCDWVMKWFSTVIMICHCFMTGTISQSSLNVWCLQCGPEKKRKVNKLLLLVAFLFFCLWLCLIVQNGINKLLEK